jgi:hypothetical protein
MLAMILLALGAAEIGRFVAKKMGWSKPFQWIWTILLFVIFLAILQI